MFTFQLNKLFESGQSLSAILEEKRLQKSCELFFGKYKLQQMLGVGSFSRVYKAINLITQKEVALKIIDFSEIFVSYKNQAARQKIKTNLLNEENHLRKCHSAHIIKVIQSFQNENCKVIVLEYCNSGNLQDYLRKRGAIQEHDAIVILKQILFGVAEMHRNQIIHRDLKPSNILIHNQIFKIADLGFAKQIQMVGKTHHTCVGTKTTIAPEVFNNQPYNFKADIWSIGVIFFIMTHYNLEQDYRTNCNFFEKIMKKKDSLQSKLFESNHISLEARDFLKRTLQVDQSKRLSWEETLSHPIFSKKFDYLPQFFIPNLNDEFEHLKQINSSQIQVQPCNMNPEESINLQILNTEYLQCRKAEYFLNKLLVPLEQKHLLNIKDQRHIELLYLLAVRCIMNLSTAQKQVKQTYSQKISSSFNNLLSPLFQRIKVKFESYSQLLRMFQSQFSSIIKDKFARVTRKAEYKQKEKFLIGLEGKGLDFTKEEQINFTYQKYIVDIVNELNGNPDDEEDTRAVLKNYRFISQISKASTDGLDIKKVIKKIIASQHT